MGYYSNRFTTNIDIRSNFEQYFEILGFQLFKLVLYINKLTNKFESTGTSEFTRDCISSQKI